MQTVAQPTTPSKAFFAHFYETHGVLTKLDGTIYFLASDTGNITEIEPEDCPWITVLGEVGLAECQRIRDALRGGAVKIACTRQQEAA